ncbi:hypothetical protein G7Y89_g11294 [Cudoniella acicularis]|uniref:DUF6604 domain-containing protein n=1 Tax=Cudoniella acicularis TaxID=354080 RepID=A0A8H4RDR9_9HELO|nr:hypothetical protein G7Y89_g11294 [Cudoniella acicularis]
MDEDFLKFFGSNYIENEAQLPFIGPYVLLVANGSSQTAKQMGIDADSKLLEKAGEVVEGFVLDQPAPSVPKSARLKGKARAEAKKASQGAKSQQVPKTTPAKASSSVINLKELLPQATAIVASKKPVIEVPTSIIQAGLRAISARKRCAAYFASGAVEKDKEVKQANHRHIYIISLMEEVLLTLQPCFAASVDKGSTAESESLNNDFEFLKNRFAALDVEEPFDQYLETPTTSRPPPQQFAEPLYEFEDPITKEDVEEEKLFALFCLFDDLWNLREYLLEI